MIRQQILTPNVMIPLGSSVSVIVFLAVLAWNLHLWAMQDASWKQNSASRDREQLREIDQLRIDLAGDIEQLRNDVSARIVGRGPASWNRSDMEVFRHDLQSDNRDLSIPPLRPYVPN